MSFLIIKEQGFKEYTMEKGYIQMLNSFLCADLFSNDKNDLSSGKLISPKNGTRMTRKPRIGTEKKLPAKHTKHTKGFRMTHTKSLSSRFRLPGIGILRPQTDSEQKRITPPHETRGLFSGGMSKVFTTMFIYGRKILLPITRDQNDKNGSEVQLDQTCLA